MQGSCLCNAIQYEVDKIEPQMAHCHCTMCRKWHGAAFASYGEAKPSHFRWLKGEEHLVEYQADNKTSRWFCKFCGSSILFKPSFDNGGLLEFALGTLDDAIQDKPDANIFTDFKADWFEINDDLPCYKEGRKTL